MFDGKVILVTGGTGSFGKTFVKHLLSNFNPLKVIIFSRDEMKQWEMAGNISDSRIRFFLGDIRDKERLYRAFSGVDYVVHAAAQKIVPTAEYNPFEAVKTNIIGAMNIIDVAIDRKVDKLVALSTDKACLPINLYGGTKLISDKLFISGNQYSRPNSTKFSVVRYGNVMGSRGSVIPLFRSQIPKGFVTITDERMTRFMVTLEQGIEMVILALQDMQGGEMYVRKVPSMKIIDIVHAMTDSIDLRFIGMRPGEKLHEHMIAREDAAFTYEYKNYFKILPATNSVEVNKLLTEGGKFVDGDFYYSSDKNSDWMTKSALRKWLIENEGKF